MATFITSMAVGSVFGIGCETSTGYLKYHHDGSDSTIFEPMQEISLSVTNANGEFTIISCDSEGNASGYITLLNLQNIQVTSFDGTGLSGLNNLYLSNNQLTSFDGTGLSNLTELSLYGNQLTSLDVSNMDNLTSLYLYTKGSGNPLTPSANDQILSQLVQNGLSFGQFRTVNGRTSASNADYTSLVNSDWTLMGLDLIEETTTTTTTTSTSSLISNVVVSTGLGKGGETFYLHTVTLNQEISDTSVIISTNIGNNNIQLGYIYYYAVDSNGDFIIAPLDSYGTLGNMIGNAQDGFLKIRNDFFTGDFRIAICYPDLNGNNQIYEIYPTVYTVSGGTTTTTTMVPSGNGKLRIKGVTSGGVAPTTTTTTTIPTPSSQADYFQILSVVDNGTTLDVTASFRLANPLVSGYLVTMDDLSDATMGNGANSLANSTLNGNPADGDAYSVGQTIATNTFNNQPNGIIVKMGPAVNTSTDSKGDTIETFTLNNVPRNTNGHTYEFNVFAYNLGSMNYGKEANFYNRNNPLRTALNVVVTGGGGKGKTQTKGG